MQLLILSIGISFFDAVAKQLRKTYHLSCNVRLSVLMQKHKSDPKDLGLREVSCTEFVLTFVHLS